MIRDGFDTYGLVRVFYGGKIELNVQDSVSFSHKNTVVHIV